MKAVLDKTPVDLDEGVCRLDVFLDKFSKTTKNFERISTPRKITVGGNSTVTIGGITHRIGVFTLKFEASRKKFEKVI